jgi:hypothetical protein
MIKSHTEVLTNAQEVIDDVICNCCGNPINKTRTMGRNTILYDYLDVTQLWGYLSSHESELHKCQICEDCCMKIASTFKIPVDIIK